MQAVSTFRLTVEERLESGARLAAPLAAARAPAKAPRVAAPRSAALAVARTKPARTSGSVAAHADDWEEF